MSISPPLLSILLLALSTSAWASPTIDLSPAIGRPARVTISGRVLLSSPEGHQNRPLLKNARRLTVRSMEGVEVVVELARQTQRAISDDEGEFEVSFQAPSDHPFPVGSHRVRATAGNVSAESQLEIVSDSAPFLVISDFDDTLAISNIQKTWAMLQTALLEDGDTQPPVAGMADFFRCLRAVSNPPPGFAVVSGTPKSFGRRLESFLAKQAFPFTALHLRRWSPKTLTTSFKDPVLRRLLSDFPQRVVLVGDSGEQDPEVYARIRQEFPGRVAAVFIHDVGRSTDPTRFENMILFQTAGDAAREAAARGLLSRSCLEASFPTASP